MNRLYVGFYSILVLAGSVLLTWFSVRQALGLYFLLMAAGVLADGITDKFRTISVGDTTIPFDVYEKSQR